jgi:hypothetical protein
VSEPEKHGAENEHGVRVSDCEDFTRWDWTGSEYDAISVAAAKLVMREAATSAAAYESVADGRFAVVMDIFEGDVTFSVDFLRIIDDWLSANENQEDGSHPFMDADRSRTEIMLADMEEACRRVRAALER